MRILNYNQRRMQKEESCDLNSPCVAYLLDVNFPLPRSFDRSIPAKTYRNIALGSRGGRGTGRCAGDTVHSRLKEALPVSLVLGEDVAANIGVSVSIAAAVRLLHQLSKNTLCLSGFLLLIGGSLGGGEGRREEQRGPEDGGCPVEHRCSILCMRAYIWSCQSLKSSRCQEDMIWHRRRFRFQSANDQAQDVLLLERPELLDELNPGRYCSKRSPLPEST